MHFLNWRMRRLLAADLLPERAAQPVKALVARSTTCGTARAAADQRQRLRPVLFLSPPGCQSPVGLAVVLNPDGTTTAWNKDKTKVIHSHSPPVRPG
jgi:hypothetical protein